MSEKPSSGGLFLILLVALGVCLPTLVLPGLFYDTQVSQRVWTLLFLDGVVLSLLLRRGPIHLPVGGAAWLVYGALAMALVLNGTNLLAGSVILTCFLLFLLVPQALDVESASLVAAASALVAALVGLFLYWNAGSAGRLSGLFNQPNLFGCFLLVGLFCYLQALFSRKRNRWLDFLPALVLSFAAFLTFSRATALALVFSFLLAVWSLRRQGGWPTYRSYILRGALVIALGWLLAHSLPHIEGGSARGDVAQMIGMKGGAYVRVNYWFSAILIGLDHFWTGAGIGGYREWLGDYTIRAAEILHMTYDSFDQTIWAHNDFLHVFAELGFPVFAALGLCFLMVWFSIRTPQQGERIFLLAAFTSFAVCMMLGHPLFYPATAFLFVVVAGFLFPWRQSRSVPRKWILAVLLPLLICLHALMGQHLWDMHNLERGWNTLVKTKDVSASRYLAAERTRLESSWDDGIHGWLFRSLLLERLSRRAFHQDDMDLASSLLPAVLELRGENRFHSLAYGTSLLYFTLGDYPSSRKYSLEAFEKKPDKQNYFDLYHLNNAFIISMENNIPLDQLISADDLEMLHDSGIIRARQLDKRGIVKWQEGWPPSD